MSAAEVAAAKDALTELENALAAINVSLTADDRQRYGSVNEQNKLFVNKTNDYHQDQPQLQTPQIDWDEFDKDYQSRLLMENLIARLDSLTKRLQNAKILYDYDNYQAALTDYAYTNYMAGTGTAGFEVKMNSLKQFFTKPTKKNSPPQE